MSLVPEKWYAVTHMSLVAGNTFFYFMYCKYMPHRHVLGGSKHSCLTSCKNKLFLWYLHQHLRFKKMTGKWYFLYFLYIHENVRNREISWFTKRKKNLNILRRNHDFLLKQFFSKKYFLAMEKDKRFF